LPSRQRKTEKEKAEGKGEQTGAEYQWKNPARTWKREHDIPGPFER